MSLVRSRSRNTVTRRASEPAEVGNRAPAPLCCSSEQLVSARDDSRAVEPSLDQLQVGALENALALNGGDRDATALEHIQYCFGLAPCSTFGGAFFVGAALPLAHELSGLGMHFEGLSGRVAESGLDES
jgi:hypothetical protein